MSYAEIPEELATRTQWVCAWANRNNAGVWYTVDKNTPTKADETQNKVQATKVIKEGQLLIQHDNQVFTVQGQPLQ